MAHLLCDRHCRRRVFVASAGLDPGPPDPLTDMVLHEEGLSTAGLEPTPLDSLDVTAFALVVTLSPEAHHFIRQHAANPDQPVEYWPVQDPGGVEGSREQMLAAYRVLRDQLQTKIEQRFDFTPPGHL